MTETELKKVEGDATPALEHVDEVIQSDGLKAAGWIKSHIAWIWGLGGLFIGYIVGHLHK